MGFGRTARGRSFVYHAGTTADSVGGTYASRGGMVSWPRSWHTPCRVWYWCQATRSLSSIRSVQGMWSHRECFPCRQHKHKGICGISHRLEKPVTKQQRSHKFSKENNSSARA